MNQTKESMLQDFGPKPRQHTLNPKPKSPILIMRALILAPRKPRVEGGAVELMDQLLAARADINKVRAGLRISYEVPFVRFRV